MPCEASISDIRLSLDNVIVITFEGLIDELRLSFHCVTQISEELHADEPISIGMRGVLEYPLRNSDATVPTIARSRHVSRQLIQTLVNALLGQGPVCACAPAD